MTVKNIEELFIHDGRDFVTNAYRNLLKREPDEHGLMYYIGRMAQGHNKAAVIAQLAKSPECRPLDEIAGLKRLTVDVKRSNSWFWQWFRFRSRIEGAVNIGTTKLAEVNTQLAHMNQHVASLQEALNLIAKNHAQQMENLVQQVTLLRIIAHDLDPFKDKQQKFSPEINELINKKDIGDIEMENINEKLNHLSASSRRMYYQIQKIILKN